MALGAMFGRIAVGYLLKKLFEPFGYTFKASVYNDPRIKSYLVDDPAGRSVLNEVYQQRERRIDYAIKADVFDAVTSLLQLSTGSTANVPTRILDELAEYTAGGKIEYMREAAKNHDWFTAVSSLVLEAVSALDPTQITDILPLYTMYEHEMVVYDFRRRMKEYRRGF